MPLTSVNVSDTVTLFKVILPVFCTVMVYLAISPIPVTPSPLSVMTTLLLTPIEGEDGIFTTTGVSITSVTVTPLGVSPLTLTLFTALPLSTDC